MLTVNPRERVIRPTTVLVSKVSKTDFPRFFFSFFRTHNVTMSSDFFTFTKEKHRNKKNNFFTSVNVISYKASDWSATDKQKKKARNKPRATAGFTRDIFFPSEDRLR